jgi:NitT/TauT family transport system substrate-binding protein
MIEHTRFAVRVCRGIAGALAVLALTARPAVADDVLNVVGASNAAGAFEVLDHVAQGAGFFKEQHLIVNKDYVAFAATAAQLVASGKADIASLTVEPVIIGYQKGLRMQYFLGEDPQYVDVLAVLDDSPIRSLADFKGAVIGEPAAASPAEISARSMLAGAGLKKSDYAFAAIGYGPQALAALVSKRVAGAAAPAGAFISESVDGNVTFRFFRHPILRDIGTYGFAATPGTIQTKGDQLRRFSRAIVEAAILTRENPRLAARYFLEGAGLKTTGEATAKEARVLVLSQADLIGADPSSRKIGLMPLLGIEVLCKFLAESGETIGVVPASQIVTDRFIDFANDFDHAAFAAHVKALR